MESWPPNRQDLVPPLRERLTPCKHTIVMIQCKLQNQSDPSCSATFRPNRSPQIYLGSTPQFPMVDPLRQFRHDSSCGNFNRGEKCHIWGSEPAPNTLWNGTPSNDTIGPAVVPFGSSQKIRCLAMSAAEEQTKQSLFRLKNKKVHYVRIQYLFLLEKHSESADLR